ncbi:MAG TPA: hypothetical protein VHW67_03160 [Solirubrobacteraceae bacterium]|nr:hypothetical protein [Solirubrobacteraceae bacterium]
MSATARAQTADPAATPPGRAWRTRRLSPWWLTAAFGVAYVIVAPLSTDLAAAGYRSDLFSRAGLTLWDNGWYGGHHLPAYSLLAPPLGALLGPQLLGALAMTLASALFGLLVAGRFTRRGERIASLWFALGAAVGLLSNRVPFELGVALALGSLLAAQGRRGGGRSAWRLSSALALALLTPLASPLAGAFLALAAVAWALATDRRERPLALGLALAALVPIALLAVAFPEGGSEPFAASAFYPVLAVLLAMAWAIPRQQRLVRVGVGLYALVLCAAYAIPTAVGGNVDRLGALLAGPLLACAAIGSSAERGRVRAMIVLCPLLLYWQLRAPIADYVSGASDPASRAAYFTPLLGELERLRLGYDAQPARIEVVPTRNRAEARWVADRVSIARGWERQLDRHDGAVFYAQDGALSAASYRAWLSRNAISYVALPDAPLDYSARAEARLLRGGAGYLREVWRSRHWRLFAVRAPTPLAQPPSAIERLQSDSFTLRAPRAGSFLVRVRFTPYWALLDGHGCIRRGREGWTEVQARAGGSLRVGIDFSPTRVFSHGPRCR